MDFLTTLDFDEFMEMYVKAKEETAVDRLYQQWLVNYSMMTTETFMTFPEYKRKSFMAIGRDNKLDKEEILKQAEKIKALDQRKGGN